MPPQSPFWTVGLALFALLLLVRGYWALLLQWAAVMGLLAGGWLLGEADSTPNAAGEKLLQQLPLPAGLLSAIKGAPQVLPLTLGSCGLTTSQ